MSTRRDRESAAFEKWLDRVRPSGDASQVQWQWATSIDYDDFIEAEQELDDAPTTHRNPAMSENTEIVECLERALKLVHAQLFASDAQINADAAALAALRDAIAKGPYCWRYRTTAVINQEVHVSDWAVHSGARKPAWGEAECQPLYAIPDTTTVGEGR